MIILREQLNVSVVQYGTSTLLLYNTQRQHKYSAAYNETMLDLYLLTLLKAVTSIYFT